MRKKVLKQIYERKKVEKTLMKNLRKMCTDTKIIEVIKVQKIR